MNLNNIVKLIKNNNMAEIQQLINKGLNPDLVINNKPLLGIALEYKQFNMASMLLNYNATPNITGCIPPVLCAAIGLTYNNDIKEMRNWLTRHQFDLDVSYPFELGHTFDEIIKYNNEIRFEFYPPMC